MHVIIILQFHIKLWSINYNKKMQVLMCNLKETQRSIANKKSQRRFQQIVDFNVDKKRIAF